MTPRTDLSADELAVHTLRLRLRPKAPATGYVDGAWWPHTADLPTELPSLLAVLDVRLGRIERISYHLADWATAPRRINVDGDLTRLAGYLSQPAHTVDVIAPDRKRLTLLVIPPGTGRTAAHRAMMATSERHNTDPIATLLADAIPEH